MSLAEAKAHCRVDTDTDNEYIAALITAAREWCASYCDETFVHTQYTMTLDSFPAYGIELPRPPMASAADRTSVSVVYTLDSQSTVALATTQYRVDRDAVPGVVRPLYGGSWPAHLVDYNSVRITWWGGSSADGTGIDQRVKNAVLWLVGYWYEKRMAADGVSMSEIPFGVKSLLDSVKWGSYQ